MGRSKEMFLYTEEDAWQASLEYQAMREERRREEVAATAEQARREKLSAKRHPEEWEEWLKVRPLLPDLIDLWADQQFDFEEFLKEVGRCPSSDHKVAREDETKPFDRGNMVWVARPVDPPLTPFLNVKQAATFLGVAVQTIYNNSRYIPSLPGFRTLMYDPKVLEQLRASSRFKSARLADQRRRRRTS